VVPAVTHVDYSARIQTVDEARHGRYWKLLKAFERRSGCPVLINTSFNVRGEPIVCTPQEALRCFLATNIDVLVLEHCVVLKEQQPESLIRGAGTGYLEQFQLD
jgi:carbamoyltransferase